MATSGSPPDPGQDDAVGYCFRSRQRNSGYSFGGHPQHRLISKTTRCVSTRQSPIGGSLGPQFGDANLRSTITSQHSGSTGVIGHPYRRSELESTTAIEMQRL